MNIQKILKILTNSKKRCENFSTKVYDFDKSFDIELPTEKNNEKEISKNKEKEKEKTDEKEIEF